MGTERNAPNRNIRVLCSERVVVLTFQSFDFCRGYGFGKCQSMTATGNEAFIPAAAVKNGDGRGDGGGRGVDGGMGIMGGSGGNGFCGGVGEG